MKILSYSLIFVLTGFFLTGCLGEPSGGGTALYSCITLNENLHIENNKIYSNTGNSCNFTTIMVDGDNPPFFSSDNEKIKNINNEIIITESCKQTLNLPKFGTRTARVFSTLEQQLFACTTIAGE